jgi:hypothetical protein
VRGSSLAMSHPNRSAFTARRPSRSSLDRGASSGRHRRPFPLRGRRIRRRRLLWGPISYVLDRADDAVGELLRSPVPVATSFSA